MEERRRFRRYESRFPAQVEVTQASDTHLLSAELQNIGAGGAFILLNGRADVNSSVDLIIPDHENQFGSKLGVDIGRYPFNLKILGRVVRVVEPVNENERTGVALEFTSSVRLTPLTA
jgi:hypothetical protein